MKIIITGGHHNSAIAVVRELKKRGVTDFLWLGHKFTMRGDKNLSAEYKEVKAAGIPFVELKAGKVYKIYNPLMWLKIPYGFLQAFFVILRFKPDLIVSFGGYLAVPVVIAGQILGVPSVTHEQTTVVGLANRVIAKFTQKIFISWPQSKKYLPAEKTTLTGLPLRKAIFRVNQKISFNSNLPTLYITGGKQGSHIINMAVSKVLPLLLKNYHVIHQSGSSSVTQDYQNLKDAAEKLPDDLAGRYILKDYFFEKEIGSVFDAADLVISRAGAHTIYELVALKKPSILIPISWVSHNEQYKNARILVNEGVARIVPEDELTGERLLKEVNYMMRNLNNYTKYTQKAQELIQFDAASQIADAVIRSNS